MRDVLAATVLRDAVISGVHQLRPARIAGSQTTAASATPLARHTPEPPNVQVSSETAQADLNQRVEAEVRQRIEAYQEEQSSLVAQAYEKAQQAGYDKGMQAAEADARQQLAQDRQKQHERWQVLERSLGDMVRSHCEEMETQAVAIAFEATGKILGEATGRAEDVHRQVRHLILASGTTGPMTVRVSPRDWALLQEDGTASDAIATPSAFTWLADPAVMGGCQIESVNGTLDARLDTMMHELRDVLLRVHRQSRDPGDVDGVPK